MFLLAAFMTAGVAQAIWLSSRAGRRVAWPLDAGLTLRGRRLFGSNKTVRGFLVMVPATGLSFVVLSQALGAAGAADGLWTFGPGGYLAAGLAAGFGFMAGELPNSFLKRQLDVPPGEPAPGALSGPLFAVADRLDSAAGMLAALSIVTSVPGATWAYGALIGPLVHGAFSLLTFQLGGKARAA
jgi:hypothetical protein